uniref:FG-GAP repeat-containing protein n=1 Tax=Hanusia phi TaxID=3032 RepID=A0A7S0I2L2_9CRYP|mmetsp:Transcript_8667/g.19657  ORF Transcript_8667/g.19657 Transcript_8667/m.19657 type:complete len:769 (+) Transcript_8667:54-2360(+)
MRDRDAGVLLVCGLAIFLALESGNDYDVKKRWVLELKPTLYKNGRFATDEERLPKPIVDDLDGDGLNEVLVATREPKLKILDPQHPVSGLHGAANGEMVLRMKAETTLLSKGVGNVRSGRQPVAMAVGYLDPATEKHRKKYVVILTHDWTVMCFDHHLKLIWESNPMKVKISNANHREASISITPTKLRPFDRGLVVVGASMEYENHRRLHRKKPFKARKKAEDSEQKDEKAEARRTRQRNKIKAMLGLPIYYDEDSWQYDHDELEEVLQHFNYFAFDGQRGSLRWKHKAGDFLPIAFDHEVTVPQQNYKLGLHTEYKHSGEVDWRLYRTSALRTLPHLWRSKEDTRMYTAHFSKGRMRDFDEEKRIADVSHTREVGLFSISDPIKGAGKASRAGTRIPKRRRAKSAKRQIIRDEKGGKAGSTPKDQDRNPHVIARRPTVKHANALVVHRKDGIEVLHLHTGRPLCELPLPANMMHADINKDGAIDRLEAIIGEGTIVRPEGHLVSDAFNPQCYAWVTTGTPPTHVLFNESICSSSSQYRDMIQGISQATMGMRGRGLEGEQKLSAAPPVVLKRMMERDQADRSIDMLDTIFLISDGFLSSYSYYGSLNWQIQTPAYWVQPAPVSVDGPSDSLMAGEDMRATIDINMMPVLEVIHLRANKFGAEYILVMGMHNGAIVSETGQIVAEFGLPDVPTGPPVVGDFDKDGYNDLIIQTRTGLTGMSINPARHRKPLSFVLGGILLIIASAMFLNQVAQRRGSGKKSKGKNLD